MANMTIEIPDDIYESLVTLASDNKESVDSLVTEITRRAVSQSRRQKLYPVDSSKGIQARNMSFQNKLDEHFLELKGML